MGTPIPGFDLGGRGPGLHFLHANGYPPDCYRPLLKRLNADFHILGMLLRPLWQASVPETIQDWAPFSEDLLSFLKVQPREPVIGMGHSIGATVTLRAALREPSHFRALVLIEPVLFAPGRMVAWNSCAGWAWEIDCTPRSLAPSSAGAISTRWIGRWRAIGGVRFSASSRMRVCAPCSKG